MSLLPSHLARYKDIAWLLMKYGRIDLVRQSGLADSLAGEIDLDQEIDPANVEDLADDLESLGPTYIKLGQFLSTRPDILPPAYLDALTRLQDRCATMPYEEVHQIITNELGVRPSRAFLEIDEKPLATGSLAQVHRAKLRSGRDVVVKVQRPKVREQIVGDLDAWSDLAALLDEYTELGRRTGFKTLCEVMRRVLMRELDFRIEAESLDTIRQNMSDFDRIRVPKAYHDFTSSRVLTMEYVDGVKITKMSPGVYLSEERADLARELFRSYLKQVLVDGLFHGDPHPGNLVVTPSRQIGLLDLGLVVRIPPRLQKNLVKLVMAISEGRGEEAADVVISIGNVLANFDRETFHKKVTQLITNHANTSIQQLNLGRLVLELYSLASQNAIQLPDEMLTISKTLLHLETTLRELDPKFDFNSEIREFASEVITRRSAEWPTLGSVYHSALEASEMVGMLPSRINAILESLANNQLKVNVEAIDEHKLITGIQKVANRITIGLILAALIIGASLMMHIDSEYTLFGYPFLALFFFLAAAIGGLGLVISIVLKDR